MNPITQTKNQNAMNERELRLGYTGTESSWHRQYKDSAWIFIGGLPYDLTEGDIICVFSQYGEIANINLVRDKETGRSKGFSFICYENQKSTVLATDNLNGIKLAGRIIRVDHVEKYKVPSTGNMQVGRVDESQIPTETNSNNGASVADFVRHHGCGPEAMRRIIEIQRARANKASGLSSSETHTPDAAVSPPRRDSQRGSRMLNITEASSVRKFSPPNSQSTFRSHPPRHIEQRPTSCRNESPPNRLLTASQACDSSPSKRKHSYESRTSPLDVTPPRHRRPQQRDDPSSCRKRSSWGHPSPPRRRRSPETVRFLSKRLRS